MAGIAREPFPRQTLIGRTTGTASYRSEALDLRDFRDVAWSVELAACLPAVITNPVTVHFEVSMTEGGDAWDLLGAGVSPAIGATLEGILANTGRFLRVLVEVAQDETVVIAVRLVARRSRA